MLGKRKRPELADVSVYMARRLSDMAQSMSALAKACGDGAKSGRGLTREDAAASVQTAAAMVCGDCSRCRPCRGGSAEDSYYLHYLLRMFEQKGQVDEEDMPRLFPADCAKRQAYLEQLNRSLGRAAMNLGWKNRFLESRDMMTVQFRELALILEEFAGQMTGVTDVTAAGEAAVRRAFLSAQVQVDSLLLLRYGSGRREACLTAHTLNGRCVTAGDAARLISRALGGPGFCAARDSRALITRQPSALRFAEAGSYRMLYGVAAAARQGEAVSGDSYTWSASIPGQAVMSLSDGMGCGAQANAESGLAADLVQQLLETGFCARAAVKLVNAVLLMSGEEQHPATVDLACVDLHTGVLEALKLGAPATFICGAEGVEILSAGQVPAGALPGTEPALLSRKLWDGDRIVMVTDGILDACPGEDKEAFFRDLLGGLPAGSPQDTAGRILRFVRREGGGARDDMTVLVAGLWKRKR